MISSEGVRSGLKLVSIGGNATAIRTSGLSPLASIAISIDRCVSDSNLLSNSSRCRIVGVTYCSSPCANC